MRFFSITTLFFLMAVTVAGAQDFKFRKVSREEVSEKEHHLEKDAEAAYLYDYRNSYYSVLNGEIMLTTEIQKRVKIYAEGGFPYAEFEVVLYDGSDGSERMEGLRAYTFNLENGKVEEYKLEKENIFEEKLNEYYTKVTFTMPNVKEGSVLEVKYKINSSYFFNIDPFVFQYGIPVNKLEARFSAPQDFTFKSQMKGYYFLRPEVTKKHNVHTNTTDMLYIYDHENIPSMKEEDYVDNINNYRAGVSYELASISIPGVYYKTYSQTWNDVAKNIHDNGLKAELSKEGYFKDELDPLLQQAPDAAQKLGVIFEFVKSRVNWDDTYGYYPKNGVRQAYKDGVGNVADINLMLTAMLRYAGLDANPVLVSTKAHGKPLFPTSQGFNYVISAVGLDGHLVLLDATSKLSLPNILPSRALNWQGRMITAEGKAASVDLSPSANALSDVTLNIRLNEDGSINGRLRTKYTNHRAYSFRNVYINVDEEAYLDELENKYAGIEIENYEIDNMKELYKPVEERFEFSKDGAVEKIADKIFLSPMLFFADAENPFTAEKRDYPVDFVFPKTFNYNINYMLPQGYQVESLPESSKFVLPDNLGSFTYHIVSQGNILKLRVISEINRDLVSPEYYEYLKGYFSEIIKKEAEKVVLSKA